MAVTTTRTKDEFVALADSALETAVATLLDTTLPYVDRVTGQITPGTRRVTRAQVLKLLARRALRKTTQTGLRS